MARLQGVYVEMGILFTTTRGAGRLGPLLPFAYASVGAGHEVLVAGPLRVAPLAERAALPFRALPEPSEDELAALWEPVFSLPREGAARVRDEIAALAPVDAAVALLARLAGEQPRAALGATPG
jgi:hypothetical protein